jgi:hypothetical protein
MTIAGLFLALALTAVEIDVINLPLSSDMRVALTPAGRADLKREGTVTRIKLEIERISPPSTLGPTLNTYVVWVVSPEGIIDSLGELDINGTRGQFNATSRLSQFGILITAEPHYMVDRPNSAVAYRSQSPKEDIRRRSVKVEAGAYDYSKLTPIVAGPAVHGSIVQARAALQIAQLAGADRLAAQEFRNAQVALGSTEEMLSRAAPLDIIWPLANEAIRLSQRAAMAARGGK